MFQPNKTILQFFAIANNESPTVAYHENSLETIILKLIDLRFSPSKNTKFEHSA